jgi:hypothetical protein
VDYFLVVLEGGFVVVDLDFKVFEGFVGFVGVVERLVVMVGFGFGFGFLMGEFIEEMIFEFFVEIL